jgi:hypothetical protein
MDIGHELVSELMMKPTYHAQLLYRWETSGRGIQTTEVERPSLLSTMDRSFSNANVSR